MMNATLTSPKYADSESSNENELLAAAIDLQSQLDQSESLIDACHHLAQQLTRVLNASRVSVLWRRNEKFPLRLLSDDQPGTAPEQSAMLLAAAEEAAILDENITWRRGERPLQQGGRMAIEQLAKYEHLGYLLIFVLKNDRDVIRGVIVVQNPSEPYSTRFVFALIPLLTRKLSVIERWQPDLFESAWRSFHASWKEHASWRTCLIVLVGLVLLLLAPATYTISVPIELQPTTRRYVTAPFDGPLKKCHVRPGDVVAEGEILAEIDERELQYELVGVRSQIEQAVQQRKGRIAAQEFGAGQIADLEAQRLRSQSELLLNRKRNLALKSPVAGMIVSGDWRSHQGRPLSRGETLFEVAPLDRMVAELCIPESEIVHVREGMPVRLATLAEPNQHQDGIIGHVRPKAELREQKNVFVAEVRFVNSDQRFYPGMRGFATIYSDKHSIGWNWFHRPWQAIRTMLGW